ncbi:hypothetical protein BGW36DRAFT_285973 [Talaromyces proteolyticus]|uniref:Transcription factor domain-containing protein n=1 Tax=Talaromyces proteolyticus TaxID=1131652 RepID=A0AAD4L4U9_9EURO|nr:uncharacterized protein BGW36DRAFT_285973 [Talaromyces proteolyticus]KAH8705997.1 hypothetical protein BGW36DRAFT_285973 [Talaromyces proteolyticus]
MPTTNDKFIFVNAPTIINAGPRDARRQLRSQLMRRVYLKKYKEPSSRSDDNVVDTIEKTPKPEHPDIDVSSSDTSSPHLPSQHWSNNSSQARPQLVLPSESKLLTPPSDGDSDDGCDQCGQVCDFPGRCHPIQPDAEKEEAPRQQQTHSRVYENSLQTFGAAKFNPFLATEHAANAPNSQMLIHYYSTNLIPSLRAGEDWSFGIHTEYMQMLADPLIFYTCCLGAAVHFDKTLMWSNGVDAGHERRMVEQSFYRYNAVRALRQVLAHPDLVIGSRLFDAVLVAICMLAINDSQGEASRSVQIDHNPFTQPLPTLGALNVYGHQPVHYIHWNALLGLVKQRGGFMKLNTYAGKFNLSYTAIKYALHTFTKPAFPICNHKDEDLTSSTPLEILGMTLSQLPPHTGDGFRNLQTQLIQESVLLPFIELAELAQSIKLLGPRCEDPIKRDLVADARNLVQYRFESLPNLTDDPMLVVDISLAGDVPVRDSLSLVNSTFAVYSLCWLSALLFTTHITFAVPSSRRFRVNTVFQLQSAMTASSPVAQNNPYVLRLQLWAMVLGGIAAEDVDLSLRDWMALQIRDLCTKLQLRNWHEVSKVMSTFAWMESACDQPGRRLWAQLGYVT